MSVVEGGEHLQAPTIGYRAAGKVESQPAAVVHVIDNLATEGLAGRAERVAMCDDQDVTVRLG